MSREVVSSSDAPRPATRLGASCVLALALTAGASCSEPAGYDANAVALERLRANQAATERARVRRMALDRRLQEVEAADPDARAISRALLTRYGRLLTPFQRSALRSSRFESYEQGEERVHEWIELNRRM